jgi:hypothetical protein
MLESPRKYTVVIERDEDGYYVATGAYPPWLPDSGQKVWHVDEARFAKSSRFVLNRAVAPHPWNSSAFNKSRYDSPYPFEG